MSVDMSFFPFFLDEATDILSTWEKSCLEYEQTKNIEAAEALYRSAHNLKSGSAAVGLGEFRNFVHQLEELISKLIAGKLEAPEALLQLLLEAQTVLSVWVENLRNDSSYIPANLQKLTGFAAKLLSREDPSVQQGSVDEEATVAGAPVLVANEPISDVTIQKAPEDVAGAQEKKTQSAAVKSAETVRVASHKLDMLIQNAGEISTQQAIVWHARQNGQLHSKSCDNAIQLMQKIAKDLQGLALSLRMQPLQTLFQRLERASLDLARSQGKKIEIVQGGEHVELDRAVIERITEALMHVIRNAIDHGVETPDVRVQQGKCETAILKLEATPSPGGVVISISDDGRGLNVERILKKAIEKDLARADQQYSTSEIHRFIFLQGFSTAEKLTDVSGRGVGMDVVKRAAEAIGGGVQVTSTAGKGTGFHISLPTTLSIMDVLIIEVSGCRYAIPVQDVSEIVDLGSLRLETASSRGRLLSLRSNIVPVEYLTDHLPKIKNSDDVLKNELLNSIQPALLVEIGQHLMAFQVDTILGQQPVAIRPLPATLDQVAGYTGGSILGDGDPCVILSLPTLMRRHIDSVGQLDREAGFPTPETSQMTSDKSQQRRHLIFRLGGQTLAAELTSIREINTSTTCQKTLGISDPFVGCIDLRGDVLPVLDLGATLQLAKSSILGPLVVVEYTNTAWAFMVEQIEAVADLEIDPELPHMARFRGQLISRIDIDDVSKRFDFTHFTPITHSTQIVAERKGAS